LGLFFAQILQTVGKVAATPSKLLKFTEGMPIACATPTRMTVPVFFQSLCQYIYLCFRLENKYPDELELIMPLVSRKNLEFKIWLQEETEGSLIRKGLATKL
jgi:hypothetical protein